MLSFSNNVFFSCESFISFGNLVMYSLTVLTLGLLSLLFVIYVHFGINSLTLWVWFDCFDQFGLVKNCFDLIKNNFDFLIM